ncbi:23S rRNA (uracil(1939)-C(5))-methyltransferase RlmD [Pseudomonas sp. Marseille-QA0892]
MARRSGGLRFQPSGGARKVSVPTGKKQTLGIERLADDGRGIAFSEGRTWFVTGALPGESVQARVLGARGQVVEARLERVLESSPQRREEPCPWARQCGGCSLQHIDHADQLALKEKALASHLERIANLKPDEWAQPLAGPAFEYRRRARVAVRWSEAAQALEVGFREASSQAIVGISDCLVLVPSLRPILGSLSPVLGALEDPRSIGHVELFQGDASVVLVRHTRPLGRADQAALLAFCSSHDAQLWLQGKGEPEQVSAEKGLTYTLASQHMSLAYRPGDFIQVNAAVNDAMVAQALEWLGPLEGLKVLDLFSGLGNFSLPLARRALSVAGVEGSSEMVIRARANAAQNGLDNVHFFEADLSKPLPDLPWVEDAYDVIVLDPPRDGAFAVVQDAKRWSANRVLYVSCNPATLARDAAELSKYGYRLVRAGAMDMFPQTAHVEAMALFERER